MTAADPTPDATWSLGHAAAAGTVSALAGLVVAELLALLLPGGVGPTAAIADRVIASAPSGPREWFIGLVGTLDKPILLIGVVVGVGLAGALVGLLCAAAPSRAPWWFGGGALLAFVPAWDGSTADALPLLVAAAAGSGTALLLWGRLAPRPTSSEVAPGARLDRRTVLTAAGLVALGGALTVGVAAAARRGAAASTEAVRAALRLPPPTDPSPSVPAAATPDVPGLPPAVTPAGDFYRIDVALSVPVVDLATWRLSVQGRVDRPLELSYDDLLALPSIERVVTLACVSNPVGGRLVGNATWQGVRLTDLLDRAGVQPDASLVVGRSVDGFTAGFPRELLADGRDAMVAYAMNGEPLPAEHGFPARLVVPGLYGYVSATKWLGSLRLTTLDDDTPYWVARDWSADGRVVAASRIDVPDDGASLGAGRVVVAGRAWHQHAGVGGVQVRVDDGPWREAQLADGMGVDAWRLWTWEWDAAPGAHRLGVRMLDRDGVPQSDAEHDVFPGAASGLHTIDVTVG